MTRSRMFFRIGVATLLLMMAGCASTSLAPVKTVADVDIQRFMGDWYVIAHIPTFIERNAFNAIERYDWNKDGTIATTFTFREGAFDGAPKRYTPTGFVVDYVNHSAWGMQFLWPLKSEFLIASLDRDYQETIIARSSRDYVWIMARTPTIPEEHYTRLIGEVRAMGYDVAQLRKVPQHW